MHKQRSKRTSGRGKFRNWNCPLSESATETVYGTVCSIDGGEDFAFSYLREEFLAKYCDESLVPASLRRSNAVDKWFSVEAQNKLTNVRLTELDPGYNILPRVSYGTFLRFVRRLIRDVLGPLHDGVVLGAFSGGASTSRRRTKSLAALKYLGEADITESAWKFLDVIFREAPMLREYGTFTSLREVKGNVLFTVPKKTDIDRCACKEPDVNMYLQKGVGHHIRRRLTKHGVYLNDQERNRSLSQQASIEALSSDSSASFRQDDLPDGRRSGDDQARNGRLRNDCATVDLSSASDTVTRMLVWKVLPSEWFGYLDDIRSPFTLVGEEYVPLEMFSSMGNGFTFELESLIFWALMRATAYFRGHSGIISVYGDDLIIPRGMYNDAEWVLREFGFTVNPDKSFHTGLFRESCGGHYYGGEDVTPFYLKGKARHLTDVIRVANQLRRWSLSEPNRQFEANLYQVWQSLAAHVPIDFWGGYDYSLDTQLVSPHRDGSGHRLCRVQRPRAVPDLGRYLSWHNTNWNRTRNPTQGSFEPATTDQICRRRRAPKGAPVCEALFWEELCL